MMNSYFRRQLAVYVEYHRDPWNSALHVFGIVSLFLAAVLPLSAYTVQGLGAHISAASIAVLPVLIYWLLLDATLGMAIVAAAVLLLSVALIILHHTSSTGMWLITGVLIITGFGLQAVGHQLFERRAPSLLDHPAHLLLGPPFVMAKLFIALGFRQDLAAIIRPVPQAPSSTSLDPGERAGETHRHS
ncbi:Mpo1-like protein [Bradyrhizobium sp.]|jgi:uncharacterized membrane protein YGL010W|uniref:Mpo1-like protein n=1 Tax=Bradyrhizobium sp. TaxID=376 RepID=UPI003C6ED400